MLKSVYSARQWKSVSLNQSLYNLWIRIFVEQTDHNPSCLQHFPELHSYFQQFQFNDIPLKFISDQMSQIKESPEKVLVQIFHLNDFLNESCFDFCSKAVSYAAKNEICNQVILHLYRYLIAFTYKIKFHFDKLIHNTCPPDITNSLLEKFKYLLQLLLYSSIENLSQTFQLIIPLINIFQPQMAILVSSSKDNILFDVLNDLYQELFLFACNPSVDIPELSPIIVFIAQMYDDTFDVDHQSPIILKDFPEFIEYFSGNEILKSHFQTITISLFESLSVKILSFISSQSNYDYLNEGFLIIQLLIGLTPSIQPSHYIPSIFALFDWVLRYPLELNSSLIFSSSVLIPELPEEIIPPFHNIEYNFVEGELYDPNSLKNTETKIVQDTVQIGQKIYLQGYPTLLSYVNNFINLCVKDCRAFFQYLIELATFVKKVRGKKTVLSTPEENERFIKDNQSILYYSYIGILIASAIGVPSASIITQTNTWNLLLSPDIFNNPNAIHLQHFIMAYINQIFKNYIGDLSPLFNAFSFLLQPENPTIVNNFTLFLVQFLKEDYEKCLAYSNESKIIDCLIRCTLLYKDILLNHLHQNEESMNKTLQKDASQKDASQKDASKKDTSQKDTSQEAQLHNQEQIRKEDEKFKLTPELIHIIKVTQSHILEFFNQWLLYPAGHKFVYGRNDRSAFILSYLFETQTYENGLDFVTRGIRFLSLPIFQRQINYVIKSGLSKMNDKKWKHLISDFLDCVIASIPYNKDTILNNFISSGTFLYLSKVPCSFNQPEDTMFFFHKIIQLFTLLATDSLIMQNVLSRPNLCFRQNMFLALDKFVPTDKTMDLLLSFALLKDVSFFQKNQSKPSLNLEDVEIQMVEGLAVFYQAAIRCGNEYLNQVNQFLLHITAHSITNRYQCFRANILISLLNLMRKTITSEMMDLFSQIGASYFRLLELSLTVRLIFEIPEQQSINVLKSLHNMAQQRKLDIQNQNSNVRTSSTLKLSPQSFFSFSKTISLFKVIVPLNQNFTIEALTEFDTSIDPQNLTPKNFLVLENDLFCQTLKLQVFQNKIFLDINNKDKTNQFQLTTNIKPHEWVKWRLVMSPKQVSFFLNDKLETSTVIRNKFKFSSQNVTATISKIRAKVENLTFYNEALEKPEVFTSVQERINWQHEHILVQYSARLVVNESCFPNIGEEISAIYQGLAIPYSISIIDSLPACGGPRILLPLIEQVKSEEMLMAELQFIKEILETNENMFLGQRFFRSLGYLLHKIDTAFISTQVIDVLFDIFKGMHSPLLKIEMLKHIWSNFNIWERLDNVIQIFVFGGVISGLLQVSPEEFLNTISFNEVLIKYTIMFRKNTQGIERCWNFLTMYATEQLTFRDSQLLIACGLEWQYTELSLAAINLIKALIHDRSAEFMKFLKEYRYFSPFFGLLTSSSEQIRTKAIEIIWMLQSEIFAKKLINNIQQPDNHIPDLSIEMLNSIRLFQIGNKALQSIQLIVSYMFKKDEFYSEFFPLFCCLIQQIASTKEGKEILTKIRSTFAICEEYSNANEIYQLIARKSLARCRLWYLYFNFLSNLDNQVEIWNKAIIEGFKVICKTYPNYNIRRDISELISILIAEGTNPYPLVRQIYLALLDIIPDVIAYDVILLITFPPEHIESKSTKESSIQSYIHKIIQYKIQKQLYSSIYRDISLNQQLIVKLISYAISKGYSFLRNNIPIFSDKSNNTGVSWQSFLADVAVRGNAPLTSVLELCKFLCKVKTESPQACLILFFKFHEHPTFGTILFESLKQSAINGQNTNIPQSVVSPITKEQLNNVSISEISNFEASLINYAPFIGESYLNYHEQHLKSIQSILPNIFIETPDDIKLIKLRNFYKQEIANMQAEMTRIARGDAKFWIAVTEQLHQQAGGPWSTINDDRKYVLSTDLNQSLFHYRMKLNKHFSNHADASALRDQVDIEEVSESNQEEVSRRFVLIDKKETIGETDENEQRIVTLELDCQMLTIRKFYKGKMYISSTVIVFETSKAVDLWSQDETSENPKEQDSHKLIEIPAESISFIMQRNYLHINNACELFTTTFSSYFFIFTNESMRLRFFTEIEKIRPLHLRFIQFNDASKQFRSMEFQEKWNKGLISNYEYIMWLNIFGGRSFHDLSQYPVFPWVIQDYDSPQIDLTDPKYFRDLKKPSGALNDNRLALLRQYYEDTKELDDTACLFRIHYSAPAYTINYMIRTEPFTSLHISLQAGKFDHPNRLFYSIASCFKSVSSEQSDFRELIPEFFTTPDILINENHFDLGLFDHSTRIDDVILPPWAKTAAEFICINRLALESPYVSMHINEWIDHIFGCKQKGDENIQHFYHPYTYPQIITPEVQKDPDLLALIQQHAANFGITPIQIFTTNVKPRIYIPQINILSQPTPTSFIPSKTFLRIQSHEKIIGVQFSKKQLYLLLNTGVLKILKVNFQHRIQGQTGLTTETVNNIAIKTIPSDMATPQFFIGRLEMMLDDEKIVLGFPWSTNIFYYDIRDRHPKGQFLSKEHSCPITAISSDENIVVSAAEDSSIVVWDISHKISLTTILAHTTQIMSVACSTKWDLVLSLDSDGYVVYSTLWTGSFIRRVKVDISNVHKFRQILFSELGIVILIGEMIVDEASITKIISLDLSGRVLKETQIEGKTTYAKIFSMPDCSSYLLIAQETKVLYIIQPFDLLIKMTGPTNEFVDTFTFCKEEQIIILCLSSGEVQFLDLNLEN